MAAIGPDVLGHLFDLHAPALRLYARQWCDDADAEDVVQDAFVALARQSTLPDHAAAWLHRVIRNAAISALRGRQRRNQREARVSCHEAWFSSVDDRIDAQSVTQFLVELDPNTREVIVARLWGGLNFDQIARLQGSSLTTIHRRYQDGLARLQKRLERPCSTPTKTE
jgi:RNA polymerase sigma-70 factor (ECF subfamily)